MALATSSTLLTDALASFANAARQAIADIENQARLDVAHASSEAVRANQQRDEGLKASQHVFQLEEKAWKQEIGACKAALSQAELTIVHQAETISQLKREATQWKDQSRNWQEHFLRVEQERCKLSTRNDELVAAQLLFINRPASGPFTPMPKYADTVPPSSPTKRASSSSSNQPPAYKSTITASPSEYGPVTGNLDKDDRRSQKIRPQTRYTDHLDQESSPSHPSPPRNAPTNTTVAPVQPMAGKIPASGPTLRRPTSPTPLSGAVMGTEPRLIRRVHACIRVPTKEEDADEDFSDHVGNPTFASEEASLSGQTGTFSTKRKNAVHSDEDDEEYRTGSEVARTANDDDDEDDELMMSPENEPYSIKRKVIPEIYAPNGHNSTTRAAPASRRGPKVNGRRKPLNKTRRV